MRKGARQLVFTAILTGLTICGTVPTAAAAHERHALLHVAAVNHAEVPEDIWQRAQATASRIYEAAGVRVVWIESASITGAPTLRSDLTIIVSAAPSAPSLTSSKHVLGFAVQPWNRGRLAYAFYRRIQDFARDRRADAGSVLGHVIAHEMGHLLLARKGHALVGLMQDRWAARQTERLDTETLTFVNDEAAVIRTRVARLATVD